MATLDEVLSEVIGLRTDMQALTAGLMQMVEVQEAHGDLLRELGEALNQEPDGPNPITEALEKLSAAVKDQSGAIERLSLRITSTTLRGVGSIEG